MVEKINYPEEDDPHGCVPSWRMRRQAQEPDEKRAHPRSTESRIVLPAKHMSVKKAGTPAVPLTSEREACTRTEHTRHI